MNSAIAGRRDRSGAARARQAVLSSRDRFWRPTDLELGHSTAHHLLGQLENRDELRRVRRGLYWRGAKTPLGMAPPPPQRLVDALVARPGVGPAGLSAANALRLSTQVPRRAEIAVPGRAPSDAGAVRFVSRAARRARVRTKLTSMEVAVLEVLDGWTDLIEVEPEQAMGRLAMLVRDGRVSPDRLARAAPTEPGRVRARLQALFERAGRADLAEQVPTADPRTQSAALVSLAT